MATLNALSVEPLSGPQSTGKRAGSIRGLPHLEGNFALKRLNLTKIIRYFGFI